MANVALLVLVHGSPRPIANEEMYRVLEQVRARNLYLIVQVGFLECNQPDIPAAIDLCATAGATEIRAVPYFLHTGTHVAQDLPELLAEGSKRHPHIAFLLGDFLGRSRRLAEILAERAKAV